MIRHSLLLIYRNFKRFKSVFFINLLGLSSGLACVMFIYLWVSDEWGIDKFHQNDRHLFQVMANHHLSDGIMTWTYTPDLLAETMAEELPEVAYAAPVMNTEEWFGKFTLSLDDEKLQASGQFVGADFFNMFSFDLLQGNKDQVLMDKNSMVISESLANKLFKTTDNLVGKTVEWQLQNWQQQHTITGVFKDVPSNSTQQFEFVLSYEVFKDLSAQMGRDLNWDNHAPSTYVVLNEGTNEADFGKKIEGFVKSKLPDSDVMLLLKPYAEAYLYGQYENGEAVGGRITYVKLFSLIALLVLVIACINFMNLSTAKASSRMKEVGVKKSIGAGKSHLVYHYLGESILMTFISLMIAIVLVVLLTPQFNEITGKHLSLNPDIKIVLFLAVVAVVTGLLAGSYPAFYLSAFKPAAVLKGKLQKSFGELWARKGLVVFQFTLSVILIVSVMVVYQQIQFVQTQHLGYDKENIVYFEKSGEIANNQETFLNEMEGIAGIIQASSIAAPPILSNATTFGVGWQGKNPDEDVNFEQVDVNHGLIETLGLEMVSGRSFSKDFPRDTASVIFNETAIEAMGLADPIGEMVNIWGMRMEIIGVVKDYHYQSFHEEINPLFMMLRPHRTPIIMAKIAAGQERETLSRLEALHSKMNPGFALDIKFLDQSYKTQYLAEQRVAVLSKYFAGLAILISCLGLFGLATFSTERRMKEIGIRKILGSTNLNIITLLSADFTKMVLLAIAIALPIGYVISQNWLQSFAYRIDLQWWAFLATGALALGIAWFTMGLQTVKAAGVNPIDCLRDE